MGLTNKEIDFIEKYMDQYRVWEIAALLNKPSYTVRKKVDEIEKQRFEESLKRPGQLEYAVYFDDEFQFYGPEKECAKKLKVKNFDEINNENIFIVNLGRWDDDY